MAMRWLREIVRGESSGPRRPGPRALLAGEDGMISILTVIVVLFFLVLTGLVFNVGRTIATKIEAQSAADAVAQSVAVARARDLNAITAANHLIGELQALVILHHAIGGPELDEGRDPDLTAEEEAVAPILTVCYELASALLISPQVDPGVYEKVKDRPRAGATVRDAVIRLQKVLTWTYQADAIAGVLQQLPPPVKAVSYPIGVSIAVAAKAYEMKIGFEWEVIDKMRSLASSGPVLQAKKLIDGQIIRALHAYEKAVVLAAPLQAERALRAVAEPDAADAAAVYPEPKPVLFQLPVDPEPESIDPISRSQLVRATYPWVNHWRAPILEFMEDYLILSLAHKYYKKYTNQFTEEKCREQKEDRGVHLYILRDLELPAMEKGQEPWREGGDEGRRRADRLFCVVGAARRSPPPVAAGGIYRQANPDGVVAYAQAMTYNANPPESGGGQPRVGWDTLNWAAAVPEFAEDRPDGSPKIRLNWQAKLTPVTGRHLTEAVASFSALHPEIGGVLRRTLPFSALDRFRTH